LQICCSPIAAHFDIKVRTHRFAHSTVGGDNMATWTPDPTFYPSPRMAMKAPPETLAYVASFDPTR
jgi:hypothetical protein